MSPMNRLMLEKKLIMEIELNEQCSLGKFIKKDCHKKSYTSKIGFTKLDKLSDIEKELYCWRSGIKIDEFHSLCYHHAKLFSTKYENTAKQHAQIL